MAPPTTKPSRLPGARHQVRNRLAATLWFTLAIALCDPAMASAAPRYMSATGSDSGTCSSASSPCRTIGYAYAQSVAGDLVQVAAGSYGAQTVTGTKTSPGVVFDLAPAARFTDVTVHANWVEFRNGQIDEYGWWTEATNPVPSNVTFRNITARNVAFNGGNNISVIGGSVGGYTAPAGMPAAFFLYGLGNELSNVMIDRVDFHDISHANASDHFEAIRIDQGAHDITIRNSRFRNITVNSSTIFISNTNAEPGDPYNFTLENNFLAAPSSAPGGGAYFAINMNAVVQTCRNFAFRYNSFVAAAASLECSSTSNVSWIGNVAPKAPGCQGNTFRNNVWQWNSTATVCGSTDTWVSGPQYSSSNLGFMDTAAGDLHLIASSPARDAGDPTSFPSVDIDCASRLLVARPDAGADEYGLSGVCSGSTPPPPAVDTTAPDTSITSGPPSSTTATSASIAFTASESGSTFACRIDGGAWAVCTNPKSYSGLATGSHSVAVRATDAAGNVDASPASLSWTITAAPASLMLLGNQTLESQVEYNPAGEAQAYQFKAVASGMTKTLKMFVDATSTATTLVVGLYSNTASNHPGVLTATARVTPVAGAWNTITLPSASVTRASQYWVAVLGVGSGTLRYRDRANAGVSETSASHSLTALPATWTTGGRYAFAAPSIWVS